MNGGGNGLRWLAWVAAGPTLWAASFALAYALHGLGCAEGWPAVRLGPVGLHRAAMALAGLAGLGACLALLSRAPGGAGLRAGLPRAGLWIGIVAIGFTLAPLLLTPPAADCLA